MKTFLPLGKKLAKYVLLISGTAFSVLTQAQTSNELKFESSSLYSGAAGADGATYRFPDVNTTMDAMVKITGRSSASVSLSNIDITSTGFSKAFQPQINRGSVSSATSWWMEFEIKFVNKGTTQAAIISEAFATGLDIDGNNGNLKEWDAFYGSTSYTVEAATQLTVSNVTGILSLPGLAGKQFLGTSTDHSGIDTSATELMTTHRYLSTNTITIRIGATTTGSASSTNRMYSVWFKNFSYNAPVNPLPVKLASFTATLTTDNKANLRWTTANEINVSHFVIERSTDGANFSDAGVVFAYGNATDMTNYYFSDNLKNVQSSIVYYRLRSVDVDEKSMYSETRIIRIGKQTENAVTIVTFPNPVTSEVRISIPADWQNKKVLYEIVNSNGQVVKKSGSASSSQTETVNMSNVNRGFYVVKVSCEGQTAQQKIIKQ